MWFDSMRDYFFDEAVNELAREAKEAEDKIPTVDVVEVVRCGECKFGDTRDMGIPLTNGHIRCNIHDDGFEIHETDWFCADGKRRAE